jgi:hypothetical protein
MRTHAWPLANCDLLKLAHTSENLKELLASALKLHDIRQRFFMLGYDKLKS